MDQDSEWAQVPSAQFSRIESLAGVDPGPVLTVLGGVHGDEIEGVLAARRIARLFQDRAFAGTLRIAAPAHPAAWMATTRLSPADGLNLARSFPGDPAGTATLAVAAALTDQAIQGADLLVDLHSGGLGFAMPLLVGYHSGDSATAERSRDAALAFGAPFLWRHPGASVGRGRSLSAAAALGIPSIYVEGRGGGRLRANDLRTYVSGVVRVMRHLGMVDGAPPAPGAGTEVCGDGDTDGGILAPDSGYFAADVEIGERVDQGARIGVMLDHEGDARTVVRSRCPGVVMLLRRPAATKAGDTVAIVATEVRDA